MKKIWLLTLASILVLAGCGSGGGGATTTPVAQQEPMQAGAVMVKPLMDVAMVGQPYENTVGVVPNDRRNQIVSLSITNLTAGGAQPSIDSTGKVTWTANDADFASTKVLRVTAKLKEGADVTVDTPVDVQNERLVYEVTMGPDAANYSDPDGRYLVSISRRDPAQPIAGSLQILEHFDSSGHFSSIYSVGASSNAKVKIIDSPISLPVLQSDGLTTQAAYPLNTAPDYSGFTFPSEIGSELNSGWNVYTSAPSVVWEERVILGGLTLDRVKSGVTKQIFKFNVSCNTKSACRTPEQAPIILINGFNPDISIAGMSIFGGGIGGGSGTWGETPAQLISAGHAVFEMQWMTHMRFEEAAGVLLRFAEQVKNITGKKPIIIAHSFGGIVAHLARQGEGIEAAYDQGVDSRIATIWRKVPITPENIIDKVITLDSPLSGIDGSPELYRNDSVFQFNLLEGQDSGDNTINTCASITCVQAGKSNSNQLELGLPSLILNLQHIASDPNLSLYRGESIYRLAKSQAVNTTTQFLTFIGMKTLRSGSTPGSGKMWELGDGLISLAGQQYDPEDLATNPFDNSKLEFSFITNENLATWNAKSAGCTKILGARNREYRVCIGAAHSSFQHNGYVATGLYNVAAIGTEGNGAVHPLIEFIGANPGQGDDWLKGTIASVTPVLVINSLIQGKATWPSSTSSTPAQNISIWATFTEKSSGRVIYNSSAGAAVNGVIFNIDAGAILLSAVGETGDLVLDHYSVDLKMGDGLITRTWSKHVDSMLPSVDLGTIDLTLPSGLVNISGTVIDGQTIGTPIAGADVWLSQGINQTAERLRLLADNNVARKVTTDALGYFNVTGLSPGDYSALVSKSGFSDQLQGSVTVAANGSLSFSLLRVLNPGDAAITLRWAGAAGGSLVSSDLDSHLIRLNSLGAVDYHIYYGNKTVFGLLDSLDRDDTSYEGPETITLSLASGMNYVYYVHNYSSYGTTLPGSYPNVTLNLGSSVQQFDLPLDVNTAGRYWRVFDIVNGQVNRCLTNCLQDIAPSGLQTQSSSATLVPQPFRAVFENLPVKQ